MREEAFASMRQCRALLSAGQDAVAACQTAVELAKDDPKEFEYLGVALRRAGRCAEAETSLRRSLELRPESASTYLNLANVLSDRGWVQEAVEAYRTALRLDPRMTAARFSLALVLLEHGQRDEPQRLLHQVVEEAPDFAEAHGVVDMLQSHRQQWEQAASIVNRYRSERIRLVCATRVAREEFPTQTAQGRSLQPWCGDARLDLMLFDRNSRPLSVVYNAAIERSRGDRVHLVFVHDDVQLTEFEWPEKVIAGLRRWHVLGVVGNRRRLKGQPGWYFVDTRWTPDYSIHLSGVVAHGRGGASVITRYGASGQRCALLDGLLLAANSAMLTDHGLRFDPQLAFHFYDLDFCRQAEARELAMGTWPIQVVHGSGGSFGSEAWRAAYELYLRKYGEPPATGAGDD